MLDVLGTTEKTAVYLELVPSFPDEDDALAALNVSYAAKLLGGTPPVGKTYTWMGDERTTTPLLCH